MHTPLDIALLGAGPAGLAAAAACAEQGLRVACVDPEPDAPWRNGYGAWVDELEAVGAAHAVRARWPRALVYTGSSEHVLARPYARIDNGVLKGWLRERAEGAGAVIERGAAARLVHDEAGSVVQLEGGRRVHARIVIDATGHASRFVARAGEASAYQMAWGVLASHHGGPQAAR